MEAVRVRNATKGTWLLQDAHELTNWNDRRRGLLGRDGLSPGEGIVITPCESIHMFGMRFAIDVVFIDLDGKIVKVCPEVKPMRLRFGGWKADRAIEGDVGMIARSKSAVGDRIEIVRTEKS